MALPAQMQIGQPPAGAAPTATPAPAGAAPIAPAPGAAAAGTPIPPAGPSAPGDWRASLPEAVRGWEEVGTAQTEQQFWDSMTNMRGRMGQSVRVPSNEAGPEDWAAFSNKMTELAPGKFTTIPDRDNADQMAAFALSMGVPAEASGYLDVETSDDNPVNLANAGAFKAIAHKHGLTPQQFKGVVLDYAAMENAAQQTAMQPVQEGIATLKGEWNQAYDQRVGAITSMLKEFKFPDHIITALTNSTVDAASLKGFYAMSEHLGGEGGGIITPQGGHQGGPALSPQEAEARIQEIMNSPDYKSPENSVRIAASERIAALQMFVTETAKGEQTFG